MNPARRCLRPKHFHLPFKTPRRQEKLNDHWKHNNRHCRCLSSTGGDLKPAPQVKIVEVGPRDGLQNEQQIVSVQDKVKLITQLVDAGCRNIEAGSFVSPKWVPAMANTRQVMDELATWRRRLQPHHSNVVFSCLVPNLHGWQQAMQPVEAGTLHEIAIFGAASETFSQRNIGCSIDESMQRFQQVAQAVRESHKVKIRGYVSCAVACPYEGPIAPAQVARVTEKLMRLGCHEVSLGDTIGVATPQQTRALLGEVRQVASTLAVHFHDTYGQALANILVALEDYDITTIDCAVAGLGGCPYAQGASGNVATEDVVYMLHGLGVETGLDLDKLVTAGDFISRQVLQQPTSRSKVGQAILAKRAAAASVVQQESSL